MLALNRPMGLGIVAYAKMGMSPKFRAPSGGGGRGAREMGSSLLGSVLGLCIL